MADPWSRIRGGGDGVRWRCLWQARCPQAVGFEDGTATDDHEYYFAGEGVSGSTSPGGVWPVLGRSGELVRSSGVPTTTARKRRAVIGRALSRRDDVRVSSVTSVDRRRGAAAERAVVLSLLPLGLAMLHHRPLAWLVRVADHVIGAISLHRAAVVEVNLGWSARSSHMAVRRDRDMVHRHPRSTGRSRGSTSFPPRSSRGSSVSCSSRYREGWASGKQRSSAWRPRCLPVWPRQSPSPPVSELHGRRRDRSGRGRHHVRGARHRAPPVDVRASHVGGSQAQPSHDAGTAPGYVTRWPSVCSSA